MLHLHLKKCKTEVVLPILIQNDISKATHDILIHDQFYMIYLTSEKSFMLLLFAHKIFSLHQLLFKLLLLQYILFRTFKRIYSNWLR